MPKNKISIPIAIIAAGFLIALGLAAGNYFSKSEAPKTASVAVQEQKPDFKIEHVRGNPDALITIVEFSDFQCSFCARFHPTVQQILDNYPNQVRWVYKHFPLGFHENAQPAAEASECAGEQDRFWEFADGLFENQSELGQELYSALALDLGLDIDKFASCVSSRKYKKHVQDDYQEGVQAGVTGTPGSFINGKPVSGAVPYTTLEAIIENLLEEK